MADTVLPAARGARVGARRRNRLVSNALVGVCTVGSIEPFPGSDVRSEFVEAARHHRVAPLAQVRLRDTDPAIADALGADRDRAMAVYLRSAMVLDALHPILDDIPWVVFKGPILSEHAHPIAGLREFSDLDVLVPPTKLRDVITRLLDAGWQIVDRDDMLRNTDVPGEMHLMSPAGILVDLHWTMINMAKERRPFTVPTEELLAARVRVPVGLSSAWTLAPADTLVHVCLHATLTGAQRMLLLLDADQLARQTEDWDAVASTAHRWGAASAVTLVLTRAQAVLGTPLPTDLGRQLGTSATLNLLTRAVDRLSPVPSLRRDASVARLVARSIRPGTIGTLVTLGRRAIRGVAERLGRRKPATPWEERTPAGAEALETYLRAVERGTN